MNIGKKFYKIGEIAEILNIPTSTLRYWEKQFKILSPSRGKTGQRRYTEKDIETIRKLNFLVKEKGLKIDAAQEELQKNPSGVDHTFRAVERLRMLRERLLDMIKAMERFKEQ